MNDLRQSILSKINRRTAAYKPLIVTDYSLPEKVKKDLEFWRLGFGVLPQAYIEWHKAVAKRSLEDLKMRFGIEVHSTKIINDGWMDGMRVLSAVVETKSGKLIKMQWMDNHRGGQWMHNGQSLMTESDLD